MRFIRTVSLVTIAAALSFSAASCSADDTKTAKPSPSATTAETVYNECIDGAVQLWDEDGGDDPISAKDCAAANLISSERTYDLDGIETVTVEGSKTTVDVTGAERIVITGDDNTIRWHGERPEIDDQGQRNTDAAA